PQGLFCWHVRATPAGALAKVLEKPPDDAGSCSTHEVRFHPPPSFARRAARARAKDALRSFSEGGHFLCLHNRARPSYEWHATTRKLSGMSCTGTLYSL